MTALLTHKEFYNTLKDTRKTIFVEKKKGKKDILLTKSVNGKPVTVVFKSLLNGKYHLTAGKYLFSTRTSNFDYSDKEKRFCRNEQFIFAVLDEIEKKELIHMIENYSSWVGVNGRNRKSNKGQLKKRLNQKMR